MLQDWLESASNTTVAITLSSALSSQADLCFSDVSLANPTLMLDLEIKHRGALFSYLYLWLSSNGLTIHVYYQTLLNTAVATMVPWGAGMVPETIDCMLLHKNSIDGCLCWPWGYQPTFHCCSWIWCHRFNQHEACDFLCVSGQGLHEQELILMKLPDTNTVIPTITNM